MGYKPKQGDLFGESFWKSNLNTNAEHSVRLQEILNKRAAGFGLVIDWINQLNKPAVNILTHKVTEPESYKYLLYAHDREGLRETNFYVIVTEHEKYWTAVIEAKK